MSPERPTGDGPAQGLAVSIDRLFEELEKGEIRGAVQDEVAPAVGSAHADVASSPGRTDDGDVAAAAEALRHLVGEESATVDAPSPEAAQETSPPAPSAESASASAPPAQAPVREVDQRASTDAVAAALERAVTSFLARPEAVTRGELATRIQDLTARLSSDEEMHPVVMSVQRLVLDSEDRDGGSMWLARQMMSPSLARALAVRLGTLARDEAGRERLTGVIARFGGAVAPALGEALTGESERVARRAYLEALTALGDDALPVVRQMASDSRWFVVRNAMLLLRETGGEEAMEYFTAALGHADPRVRKEALISLAYVGGDSGALLVTSRLGDPDTEVRQAAARACGAIRSERATRPLLQRLDEEEDTSVQEVILIALGQIGDPGAVPAIEKRAAGGLFSRKAPPSVRVAAYKALAGIGTPHARKLVLDAANDRDPDVRDAILHLKSG